MMQKRVEGGKRKQREYQGMCTCGGGVVVDDLG